MLCYVRRGAQFENSGHKGHIGHSVHTGFSVTDFMKFSDTYFSELSRIIFIPVNTFFLQLIMIQVIKQTVLIIFTTENIQNGKNSLRKSANKLQLECGGGGKAVVEERSPKTAR